ncbi:MAG: hypothetical protein AAF449_15895 [Myxococcota bacterium]
MMTPRPTALVIALAAQWVASWGGGMWILRAISAALTSAADV